jgi:hypothetical protein
MIVSKLETAGFKKWWPMRELQGRGENGEKLSREVFVNMASEEHETFVPTDKDGQELGWSGSLPRSFGAKDGTTVYSSLYAANFEKISWDTPGPRRSQNVNEEQADA